MLARGSSDAGNRLRRSKSVSTVQRPTPPAPELLDPEVAQRHALAAATIAYARAHEHEAVVRPKNRSSELSRTKSTPSRKSLTSQGSHFPPRDASVRPTQPSRASNVAGAGHQFRDITTITEKFPSFYPASSSERPLSAQPPITFNENVRPSSQSKMHQQSAASSITSQQIRKARSMYYASSVQTGSPIARPPAKYLTTPPLMTTSPAPTASPALLQVRKKAASPLASPQVPVTIATSETIDKARDKYLQNFQQRQIKHKPSIFLAPFKKRQDRAKKKEPSISTDILSTSSASRQMPNEVRMESLDDFGMPKQKKEKRSFSGSIKDKFKRAFRRTSNTTTILPVQQIDASRDYFSYQSAQREQHSSMDRGFEIPSPTDDALVRHRSRSRTPILERAISPFPHSISRESNRSRGSNRSLHSETNATLQSSRVTSWSDASAEGTLTQRDVKRLTVIHEAKDSIGSVASRGMSTSSLPMLVLPPTGITAFRDPMPLESLVEETSTPVDPKRVFSALMKEIDASKASQTLATLPNPSPSASSDVFESSTTKELHSVAPRDLHSNVSRDCRSSMSSDQRPSSHQRPHTARSKTSSIKSFGRALKSTIRTITPTEHPSSPLAERTTSVRGAVRIPRPVSSGSTSSDSGEISTAANTTGSINFEMGTRRITFTQASQAPHMATPSAEQIEQRVTKSKDRWKTPLDKSPEADVPQHIHGTCNSITDLANRAFSSTPLTTVGIPPFAELEGDSPTDHVQRTTPTATSPKSPKPRQLFSPLSPSVYSRNTDGMSILPTDSVMSFDGANDDDVGDVYGEGSAVIITSHAVKSYVIGTPSPQRQMESARSSRDWKAWLSHEILELGSPVERDLKIDDQYTQAVRHRREFTQIEEDEDTTVTTNSSMETAMPRPYDMESRTPQGIAGTGTVIGPTELPVASSVKSRPAPSPMEQPLLERKVSPPIEFSPALHSAAALGEPSSAAKRRSSTPISARMNDRFPFIKTSRRSSSQSTGPQRSSRTPTEGSSGSSSLRSRGSKATPSPKVYSDFSAPGSARTSRYEPNIRSKRTEEIPHGYEDRNEDISASFARSKGQKHMDGESAPSPPLKPSPTKSMLPLSSAARIHNPSTLTQYTTTTKEFQTPKALQPSSSISILQRQTDQISPRKLDSRPKSAYELRGSFMMPSLRRTPTFRSGASSNSPKKRQSDRYLGGPMPQPKHIPFCASATDSDSLSMLLESPWALSGPPLSPRASVELCANVHQKPKLRVKHSSSALALNKEPSPGSEERNIDVIIDERSLSARSSIVAASVKSGAEGSGRVTPGHRMAERFLRERSVPRGSGAGSPISLRSVTSARTVKKDSSPAFL